MRGRIVSAFYLKLGLPKPHIVKNIGNYTEMAIKFTFGDLNCSISVREKSKVTIY